jgi:hypothetical protein
MCIIVDNFFNHMQSSCDPYVVYFDEIQVLFY